jgi:transcriptional regulator with XRE-family HTH domain
MSRCGSPRTKLQQVADRRARRLISDLVFELTRLREDAGLSQRGLAIAAGLTASTVSRIEAGEAVPTIGAASRLAAVLGADVGLRLFVGTGPMIRDHLQAAMVQALLRSLDLRWQPRLEVPVVRPVRGVIDLVIGDPLARLVVATEVHSEMRRLEQQLRWAALKADALAQDPAYGGSTISRLLVLRSTAATRAAAASYRDLLSVAYPAPHAELLAALLGTAAWPGPGILWCVTAGSQATLLAAPPRGVRLGR